MRVQNYYGVKGCRLMLSKKGLFYHRVSENWGDYLSNESET